MIKKLLICAAIGVLALTGAVLSQTISIPQVQVVNPNDLIPIVPRGVPSAQGQFATPAQITAQSGYYKSIPGAGFTFIFGNSQTFAAFNPAGTIATGTVTLAPNPSDGARECIFTTQTITSLTINANTGQTINNAVTTLVANTGVCYLFSLSTLAWDRN